VEREVPKQSKSAEVFVKDNPMQIDELETGGRQRFVVEDLLAQEVEVADLPWTASDDELHELIKRSKFYHKKYLRMTPGRSLGTTHQCLQSERVSHSSLADRFPPSDAAFL
jgi:hypothetical protein